MYDQRIADLEQQLAAVTVERDELRGKMIESKIYPHMCRDEHPQIGHSDSESERCPLCVASDERDALAAALETAPHHDLCHCVPSVLRTIGPCICWKRTSKSRFAILAERDERVRREALREAANAFENSTDDLEFKTQLRWMAEEPQRSTISQKGE